MESFRLGRLLLALTLLSTVVGFDLDGCLNGAFVRDLPPGAGKAAHQVLTALRNDPFLHFDGETRTWGRHKFNRFLSLQRSIKQLVEEASRHAELFRHPSGDGRGGATFVPRDVNDLRPGLRGLLHLLMIEPQFGPTGIEALHCRLDETLWVLPEETKLTIPLVMARGRLRVLASRIIIALDRNLLSPDANTSSGSSSIRWWPAYETIAHRVEPLLIMLRSPGGEELHYWQRLMGSAHPKSFKPFRDYLIDSIKRLSSDFEALGDALPRGKLGETEEGRLEQLSLLAAISGWLDSVERGFKVFVDPAIDNDDGDSLPPTRIAKIRPSEQGGLFVHLANRVLTVLTFEALKLSGMLAAFLFRATMWVPGSLLTLAPTPAWQSSIDGCPADLARSTVHLEGIRHHMDDALLSFTGPALHRALRQAIKKFRDDDRFPVEAVPDLISYLASQPGVRHDASNPDQQRYQDDLRRSRDEIDTQWAVVEEIMRMIIIGVVEPGLREELLLLLLLNGNGHRHLIWASAFLAALGNPDGSVGSLREASVASIQRWDSSRLAAHVADIVADTAKSAPGKKGRDHPYLAAAMDKIFGIVGLTSRMAFTDI